MSKITLEKLEEVDKFAKNIRFKFEQLKSGYSVFSSKVYSNVFVDIEKDVVRIGARNLYTNDIEDAKEFAGELQKAVRIAEKFKEPTGEGNKIKIESMEEAIKIANIVMKR